MPSHLHERFLALVEDTIGDGIKQASRQLRRRTTPESLDVATQLSRIYKGRSADIELRGMADVPAIVRRSPDATFYRQKYPPHIACDVDINIGVDPLQPHLPRLVVEVSYSQPPSDLERLAKSYIIGSHGSIGYVLAFALPYSSPSRRASRMKQRKKCARVTIWKGSVHDDGTDTTIRCTKITTADLNSAEDAMCCGNLELDVTALLPTRIVPVDFMGLPRTISIKFPLVKFGSFLSAFETKRKVFRQFAERYNLRKRPLRNRLPKLFAKAM